MTDIWLITEQDYATNIWITKYNSALSKNEQDYETLFCRLQDYATYIISHEQDYVTKVWIT